jgi:pseudouridine synthase
VTENLEIRIDDQPISELIRTYLAFHKPLDVATTATVPHSTQLISQHLPTDITGLSPAGRLDTSTSGLLLVSNDSEWNALAASANGYDKEFLLKIAGHVTEVELGIIRAGVQVPRVGEVKPKSIDLIEDNGHICSVNLVLREGKVRQIRSLFTALRLELESIHRIRIGPVRLDSLVSGCWRSLSKEEIEMIRKGTS